MLVFLCFQVYILSIKVETALGYESFKSTHGVKRWHAVSTNQRDEVADAASTDQRGEAADAASTDHRGEAADAVSTNHRGEAADAVSTNHRGEAADAVSTDHMVQVAVLIGPQDKGDAVSIALQGHDTEIRLQANNEI